MRFARVIAAAAALMAAAFITAAPSYASDQTALLDDATQTVRHMRHDPDFGPSERLLHEARAVLIIPNLVKGGFIFGGEGGNGVLVEHHGRMWSQPVFYTMGSASFGFQAGLEQAQLVMFIMSDRALRAVERSKFKFGAGAGLTVVSVGANAEGSTSTNLTGDIIVWASSKGLYGGLTLNGSVLEAKDEWNRDFYGRDASIRTILEGRVHNPATRELRDALGGRR